MQAQTRTLAAAGPRLSTATRSRTGDPGRAGAVRLALLATAVAAGAGAIALVATRQMLENATLSQLETVRAAVAADVERFTRTLADATVDLAADPRLATYLREARDARRTSPARARGGEEPTAARPPRWLATTAQRNGWSEILLVEDASDRIVYASGSTPQLVVDSGLDRLVKATESRTETAGATIADVGPDPAFRNEPVLYAAAPIVDGSTRLGTLVVAVDDGALEKALHRSSGQTVPFGLGDAGSVWLVDASQRLRSNLGGRVAQGAEGSELPADTALPALAEALRGEETAGSYASDGGAVLAAYSPLEVGNARWAVGVQVPEAAAMAPLRRIVFDVAGAALVAAILGWLLGGRLWGQFSGKLRELSAVLARAQRGDRQARLDAKQGGPVGELAAAINRLLDERANALARAEQENQRSARDAESLLNVVKEVARGNFAQRAQIEDGALGNVSRALNEMLEGIGNLVGTMRAMSGRLGDSATQIRGCTDQVSSTASSQARECGSLLGTANALRSGNQQISEQCAAAVEVARRTEQASKLGQSALADLISGMDGLQRETRAATVKIKRLGERSMQISAITGTISKMSAQTDMLALNAAIEASRAGEHGQGFTVVAEEVRKLAERAAAATKEVERLIAGIQSDVNEAVSGMERQAERLEVQTAAASQAEHALERVHAVTNEATTMLEQIAGAATAQVERASEIDAALKRIAEAAKGVQQSSEQARRTTSQLVTASEELGARASQFAA
jgi:methyl-accepting chemotaxis protein